ncbi:MAG: helicase-exonuclease AddAB subunit AddA [Lachnospiraceae bacterium]|nr:helicase-exonuclease AddAB subunit AddA [Lachnospiraceae bacterium]
MEYTKQQKEVIETRNRDVLVSAGAGSGKTAVLTERIMSRLTDPKDPVSIDRMLVLTFTRAAAAQMKQRLQDKIAAYVKAHPGDQIMKYQESLLHNAQITTIDSFCQFLLRSHYHQVGVDPAFRIADQSESVILEDEVLREVLEEAFAEGAEDFLDLAAALNPNARELDLEKSILSLSHYAASHPWPVQWMKEQVCREEEDYLRQLQKKLAKDTAGQLESVISLTETLEKSALQDAGAPHEYAQTFLADRTQLCSLREKILEAADAKGEAYAPYEAIREAFAALSWARLAPLKKETKAVMDEALQEVFKKTREAYKKSVKELGDQFAPSAADFVETERSAKKLTDALLLITIRFSERLLERKKERNLFSFPDIEHLALEILYQDGKETETARVYREYFEEVMVDEYQDSNEVQEILLQTLAKQIPGRHDRFMVGDKKQSIYRFRMSRPEIFTEKYESYRQENEDHKLILLSNNFRSRDEVIDSVNGIFSRIMREEIGGVNYDADEALIRGGTFCEIPADQSSGDAYRRETELLLCENDQSGLEKRNLEFAVIAERIRKMVGHFLVEDGNGGLRPLAYRDIVILLRSTKNIAGALKEALEQAGIPAHGSVKGDFYQVREIARLLDLLRVLQNPYYDIPLVAALKSEFFNLSDEELATIRLFDQKASFYESLQKAAEDDSPIGEVAKRVQKEIASLRELSGYLSVTQLLQEILRRFHYREQLLALPLGEQRAANVDLLLQKTVDFEQTGFSGLFQFIRYVDTLAERDADESFPDTLSETADVVRIMSIHSSKGLEFPVVFLAACDKQFNKEDLKKIFLMDLKEGVAGRMIDTKRRIKGTSFGRNLIKSRLVRESYGEEMRLLYVAATRAKEKLIFTATAKDTQKKESAFSYLSKQNLTDGKIPLRLLEQSDNYLDQLLLAYRLDQSIFLQRIIKAEDVDFQALLGSSASPEREEELEGLLDWETQKKDCLTGRLGEDAGRLYESLRDRFSFVYPYQNLEQLYAKTSVSELKHAAMEEEGVQTEFETDKEQKHYIPSFAGSGEKAGGTRRGTAYHRVMELLDLAACVKAVSEAKANEGAEDAKQNAKQNAESFIREQIEEMIRVEKIEREDAELVSVSGIMSFLASDCAGRMARAQEAGKLYREQPFIINIEASLVNPGVPAEESVMIQGVIDVCWEEDGKLYILDYKTDRIDSMQALYERYHTQLAYYKRALEQATGKEVAGLILYSFHLHEEGVYPE